MLTLISDGSDTRNAHRSKSNVDLTEGGENLKNVFNITKFNFFPVLQQCALSSDGGGRRTEEICGERRLGSMGKLGSHPPNCTLHSPDLSRRILTLSESSD